MDDVRVLIKLRSQAKPSQISRDTLAYLTRSETPPLTDLRAMTG